MDGHGSRRYVSAAPTARAPDTAHPQPAISLDRDTDRGLRPGPPRSWWKPGRRLAPCKSPRPIASSLHVEQPTDWPLHSGLTSPSRTAATSRIARIPPAGSLRPIPGGTPWSMPVFLPEPSLMPACRGLAAPSPCDGLTMSLSERGCPAMSAIANLLRTDTATRLGGHPRHLQRGRPSPTMHRPGASASRWVLPDWY